MEENHNPRVENLQRQHVSRDSIILTSRENSAKEGSKVRWAKDNRGKGRVTVIIPTLNESKNLPEVLPKISFYADEIIVVDGHSTDETLEIAERLVPEAIILTQKGRGKGEALRIGYEHATGDYIIQIDADGSMNPQEIPKFVDALAEGYDVVKGSRRLPGGGSCDLTPARAAGNLIFVKIVNFLFKTSYTDLCYGFIGFRREALNGLKLKSGGFSIETEIAIRAKLRGLKVKDIPSYENRRLHGHTNLSSFKDGLRIFSTILKQYRAKNSQRHRSARPLPKRALRGS